MRLASWVVGAGIPLVLMVVASSPRTLRADEEDVAGLRKQCQAIVAGWNKHDAGAIAAVFATDADMIGPDGNKASGRDAVREAFAADHGAEGAMRSSTVKVIDEPIRFVTPDVAISDAEVRVTGIVGKDGTKMDADLHVTNIWKRSGDTWLVFASRPYIKKMTPAQ